MPTLVRIRTHKLTCCLPNDDLHVSSAGGKKLSIGGECDMVDLVEVICQHFGAGLPRHGPRETLELALPASLAWRKIDLVVVDVERCRKNGFPQEVVVGDVIPPSAHLEPIL